MDTTTVKAGIVVLTVVTPTFYMGTFDRGFTFPKLLLLNLGTLLLFLGVRAWNRRLLWPASAWLASMVAATLFGVDPWMSLTGNRGQASGLLLMIPCAVLVVVGTSLDEEARRFAATSLTVGGMLVAAVAVAQRFGWVTEIPPMGELTTDGSTLGLSVLMLGFLAAALGAALAHPPGEGLRPWSVFAAVGVVAAGIGAAAQRASLLIPAIVVATYWIRVSEQRRRSSLCAAIVLVVSALMFLAPTPGTSANPHGEIATGLNDEGRLATSAVFLRASLDRPLFGWGPDNASAALLNNGTRQELEVWYVRGDAHNLPLQVLVTTGIVGLLTFLWLVWTVARGLVHAPADPGGWTLAAMAGLLVYAFLEPITVVATPLLFFVAGIGAGSNRPEDDPEPKIVCSRPAKTAGAAVLVAAVAMSGLMIASELLRKAGNDDHSISTLRTAVAVWPWSHAATEDLAFALAQRGAAGDSAARAEALQLAAKQVAQHPYEPTVYLASASVARALGDEALTEDYLARYRQRFPGETTYVNSVTGG